MTPWTWGAAMALAVVSSTILHRAVRARSVERVFEARYRNRRNVQGVIAGAESFTLQGTDDRAIVLLHGYNDSPQALRFPAAVLHAAGWTVYVPLLPGHGRSLRAFAATSAGDWIAAGRDAVRAARQRHRRVAVGGLSMGGAIATILAAEEREIVAAVLFAPFLVHSRRLGLIAGTWPLVNFWTKYLTGGKSTRSIRDPAAREAIIAYGCSTPRLMREIRRVVRAARAVLPIVEQPVFIAQSSDDYRIPAAQAQAAFDLLASADKHMHWTTGNGHVITMDYGHEVLAHEAVSWINMRVPATRAPSDAFPPEP